jgi:hypothetical protein
MSLILSGTDGLSDVDGSASTPAIRGTDTNTGIFFPAADTIAFAEGGAEVARFDSSGNLGVNTTTPNTKVQSTVGSNGSGVVNALRLQNLGTSVGDGAKIVFTAGTSTDGAGIASTGAALNSADLRFYSGGNTERMRIDVGGTVLFGSTSSAPNTNVGVKIGSDGADGFVQVVGTTSTNDNVTYRLYSTGAGGYRFYVGYAGTVYATNTTITSISDQRLKENIRDLDDGLNIIMSLTPRKFDWKEGKGTNIKNARGFIAQEFEQVLPDMVEEWLDPAPEGEEPYKAVNANLIPILVKAIQELKAELDSVKAELATLKA